MWSFELYMPLCFTAAQHACQQVESVTGAAWQGLDQISMGLKSCGSMNCMARA